MRCRTWNLDLSVRRIPSPKRRTRRGATTEHLPVVAYLALAGRPHALWLDKTKRRTEANLRSTLWRQEYSITKALV